MASIYDTFADSCAVLAAKTNANPIRFNFFSLLTNGARFLQTAKDPAVSLLYLLPSLAPPRIRYRCLRGRLPRPLCAGRNRQATG